MHWCLRERSADRFRFFPGSAALGPSPLAIRALQQHRDAPTALPPILHSQSQDRLCQHLRPCTAVAGSVVSHAIASPPGTPPLAHLYFSQHYKELNVPGCNIFTGGALASKKCTRHGLPQVLVVPAEDAIEDVEGVFFFFRIVRLARICDELHLHAIVLKATVQLLALAEGIVGVVLVM